jgi:hypothetical protein
MDNSPVSTVLDAPKKHLHMMVFVCRNAAEWKMRPFTALLTFRRLPHDLEAFQTHSHFATQQSQRMKQCLRRSDNGIERGLGSLKDSKNELEASLERRSAWAVQKETEIGRKQGCTRKSWMGL